MRDATETCQPGGERSVGVVVVTYRAREHLRRLLPPLQASRLRPRLLVVNSSSRDGTVELAQELGAETLVVSRASFNHGATREQARRLLGTDVVVMLTPDVHPVSPDFLERLTAPVRSGEAAVAYGRQIARVGAGLLERMGRTFNYPPLSHTRTLADWDRWGSYTHFCSNACAAWSSAALDRIGGFTPTLVSEETIAAARLLARGERIAYVAEAIVVHSHPQGPLDAFRRQFDIGYTRRLHADLLLGRERDEVRGRRFVRAVLAKAWREAPAELHGTLASLAASWLGYRTGLLGPWLPRALASRLSGQDFYWLRAPGPAEPASLAPA